MQRILSILILLAVLGIGGWIFLRKTNISFAPTLPSSPTAFPSPGNNKTNLPLTIPAGYEMSIYAEGLGNPRVLALDPQGTLIVSIPQKGTVVALPDKDKNGLADSQVVVAQGLSKPHGLAFYCHNRCQLYIAETDQVGVFDYDQESLTASNKQKILDLPTGGIHFTRTLSITPDGKLLISVGSSCNVCNEKDIRRAAVLISNLDGTDSKVFASGLRNSVFLTLHPRTQKIWATDMGRDLIGDDIPPDEVNVVEEGKHYGWPYCYGKRIHDANFDLTKEKAAFCNDTVVSLLDLQAHSAPLGLAFLGNDLLVAYHGSWNRRTPTGYKIVRFKLDGDGRPLQEKPEDWISGWLTPSFQVLGRPVDILIDKENIFISDDQKGVVYLVKSQ